MKDREVRIILKIKTDASIDVLRQVSFWRASIQAAWRMTGTLAHDTLHNIYILEAHASLAKVEEKSNGSRSQKS